MIQNVNRRKDTTRGLFCKTTNKTNGVCFMLSLEVRLYVCLCAIVLLQHIYLESVEVKSLYKVDVVPVLIAKTVFLKIVKISLSGNKTYLQQRN